MKEHGQREERKKDESILSQMSKLNNLMLGEKEGERIVNISSSSEVELGRLLAPMWTSNTLLFCGRVAKIKTYMEAIRTPGYPLEYLEKTKFTTEDIKKIPKEKAYLPNYWALVALGVVERVRQDKKLAQMLKVNNLEFTLLDKPKRFEFDNRVMEMSLVDTKLRNYVSIIRHIELMIKQETFNDKEVVAKFINDCKSDKSKDLFDNIQLPIREVSNP